MIAIVDYDAGNLTSVARAISHIGYSCVITKDNKELKNADRIIFPGVGAAGTAMTSLKRFALDDTLKRAYADGKPMLGICLGTQIIMTHSSENDTMCLGLLNGGVKSFSRAQVSEAGDPLKIPHMGWNRVQVARKHALLEGIREDDEFYFVHSYYPEPENEENIFGQTEYGIRFASILGKDTLFATQFHVEKSGRPGLRLLKNFCEWKPE